MLIAIKCYSFVFLSFHLFNLFVGSFRCPMEKFPREPTCSYPCLRNFYTCSNCLKITTPSKGERDVNNLVLYFFKLFILSTWSLVCFPCFWHSNLLSCRSTSFLDQVVVCLIHIYILVKTSASYISL